MRGALTELLAEEWRRHRQSVPASGMRLSELVSAGDSTGDADAACVAFQVDFPDMRGVEAWVNGPWNRIVENFYNRFGNEAMTFSSVFRVLDNWQPVPVQ